MPQNESYVRLSGVHLINVSQNVMKKRLHRRKVALSLVNVVVGAESSSKFQYNVLVFWWICRLTDVKEASVIFSVLLDKRQVKKRRHQIKQEIVRICFTNKTAVVSVLYTDILFGVFLIAHFYFFRTMVISCSQNHLTPSFNAVKYFHLLWLSRLFSRQL